MANTFIHIPYSQGEANLGKHNDGFWSDALKRYLSGFEEQGIPIGSRRCVLDELKGSDLDNGLDYFLRVRYARYVDIQQAVEQVIKDLVETGDFEVREVKNNNKGRNPRYIFLVNN